MAENPSTTVVTPEGGAMQRKALGSAIAAAVMLLASMALTVGAGMRWD